MKISSLITASPLRSNRTTASPQPENAAVATDSVQLSLSSQPPARANAGFWKQAAKALVLGTVTAGCLASGVAAQAQVQVQKGLRYDRTLEQVTLATRNSVTADQIPSGQPHLTAWDVDSTQSTKIYHNPDTLAPTDGHSARLKTEGDRFQMCTRFKPSGDCATALSNQISYSVLSCVYYQHQDGQFYRVTHKSYQHQQTHAMQRNVCGGHELRREAGEFASYAPQQTTRDGDQLFLNPANILRMERVPAPAGR